MSLERSIVVPEGHVLLRLQARWPGGMVGVETEKAKKQLDAMLGEWAAEALPGAMEELPAPPKKPRVARAAAPPT